MLAYYRRCDMRDPACRMQRRLFQEEYAFWQSQLPEELDSEFEWIAEDLAFRLQHTKTYVENRLWAVYALQQLPTLHALQQALWHLDFPRLIAIANTLNVATDKSWGDLDLRLAHYLHPKRENQAIPSAKQIRRFILEYLEQEAEPEQPSQNITITPVAPGLARLEVISSEGAAETIRDAVTKLARRLECTAGEALLKMALGENPNVVVNTYEAHPARGLRTASGAKFSASELATLKASATFREVDFDAETAGYRFSQAMRASIAGRDGHCRYPDCNVAAVYCDIDHVVPYGQGGPTSPRNAQLLCRHHHNKKTKKEITCEINEHGLVTWKTKGGTILLTYPEGFFGDESCKDPPNF